MRTVNSGVSFRVQRVRRRRRPRRPTVFARLRLHRLDGVGSRAGRLRALVGVVALVVLFTMLSDQVSPLGHAASQAKYTCQDSQRSGADDGAYTVPVGVTSLDIEVAGAHAGGNGAVVDAVVPVQAGEAIEIYLGCGSTGRHSGGPTGDGKGVCHDGGDGGGSSALYDKGANATLVEAGGAGGNGGRCPADGGGSGGNGSLTGDNGTSGGGHGGDGGAGGNETSGNGTGGGSGYLADAQGGGGGGGGGCKGGGGGGAGDNGGHGGLSGGGGGGGGGSSCAAGSIPASAISYQSTNGGDGYVTINPISMSVRVTATYKDSNNDGVQNANDAVEYTIVTKNDSSVALNNVTVTGVETDTGAPLDVSACAPLPIQPGNSSTCVSDYPLLLTDLNRGTVNTTVTSTGELPTLPNQSTALTVSASAGATTTLDDTPALTVDTTVSGVTDTNHNGLNDAGDVINYRIQVTNGGNSTVRVSGVSESVTGKTTAAVPVTCTPVTPTAIPPVATKNVLACTASYTITAADVDTAAAAVSATATATGTSRNGAGGAVSGTSPAVSTGLTQSPGLAATLAGTLNDANGDGRTDVGDTISYTATVANSGSVTLDDVGVTIALSKPAGTPPTLNCSPGAPAKAPPGTTITCTGTYAITQADMDNGEVDGTANGTGTFGSKTVTAASPQTAVALQRSSGLTVAAAVAGVVDPGKDGVLTAGDAIKYSITVTNTGSVSLNQVTLTDHVATPAAPDPDLTCNPTQAATLSAGAVMTCTGTYAITQADVDKGTVTDTASAVGVSPTLASVTSNTSTVTTTLGAAAAMSLTNTVTAIADNNHDSVNDAGDVIDYAVVATNTGTVTLTGVTIADPLTPPAAPAMTLDCSPGAPVTLVPGAALTCTGSYTITQADVDKGAVTASATVSAKAPDGSTVTAGPVPATTAMASTGTLTTGNVVTSVEDRNGDSVTDQGDVIVYSVTLTNVGSLTLGTVTATETLAAPAAGSPPLTCDPAAPGSLAPGKAMTCAGSYQVTAADVRNGSVKATASGSGVTPTHDTVHAPVVAVVTAVSATPAGSTPGPGTAPNSPGGAAGSATGGGVGPLAYTGVSIVPVLTAGVLCLGVGTALLLVMARRRRKQR